jgi:5-methylthioadenosine/S-adenosylhomocysteine deaminase
MRLAATLPKGKLMKPDIVTAKDVFQMATINGAKALGKSSEIGSLEIGKQADMVIISTNSLHSVPLFDPLTHLVYSCSKSDVKHVYIAGKQCVKDGSIINFDIENIIKEVRKLKMPTLNSLL